MTGGDTSDGRGLGQHYVGGADTARRRDRLLGLLVTPGAGLDGAAPVLGQALLGRLCELAVSEIGVSGAGVTVMAGLDAALAGDRDQAWATGALTRRLESLQLTTGEGPCLDAFAGGAPVLVGDLGADPVRWIGFGPEALSAGAAAVFSFPLQVGAVRLGTLDLHRDSAGTLSREQLADALVLAGLATEALLDPAVDTTGQGAAAGDRSGPGADTFGWLPGVHAQVHQACGMVSARERIGADAALLRIRAHAYAHGEPIDRVARRIVDRTLVLDEQSADEPDVVPDDHPDHNHPDHDRPDHDYDDPGDGPHRPADLDEETDR